MIHKLSSIILWSVLFFAASLVVQAQMKTCRLSYDSINKETGISSGTKESGTFSFNAEHREIIKWFTDLPPGTRVWVGARIYGGLIGGSRKHIEVAIAFKDIGRESRGLFRYADSAIAETLYDEKLKFISVSKIIETKDEIYRFRFSCSRDK